MGRTGIAWWVATAVAAAGVMVAGLVGAKPASAADGDVQTYMYCASRVDAPVVYFSDIFLTNLGPRGNGGGNPHTSPTQLAINNISSDYLAFLVKKYKTNAPSHPTGCPNFGNGDAGLQSAQTSKQKLEDQVKAAKGQVVETEWKNE